MTNLDIFIKGENIDLRIPTKQFAYISDDWYAMFNDNEVTKYLDQGIFPNTREDQKKFFESSMDEKRIIFIICDKKNNFIGVISLSNINFIKRQADIALTMKKGKKNSMSLFSALEAIALMTSHGFDNVGLNRISAGQAENLNKWQNMMELCGYKLEGINKEKFIKGKNKFNNLEIACIKEDYLLLKKLRKENLWDNRKNFIKRYKQMPKQNYYKLLVDFEKKTKSNYYKKIFKL